MTASVPVNVVRVPVRPSGPASRAATSASSRSSSSRGTRPAEQALQLASAEAVLGRPRPPLQPHPRQVDRLLAVARLERGDLGGVEARAAPPLQVVEHLRAPLRERAQRRLGDAGDLRHPVHRLAPLHPERAGQLEAQLRLVQIAGSEPVALQQRLAVERAPDAVGAARHVRDDHVRMQMRILRPRGAVLVRGRDEPEPRSRTTPFLPFRVTHAPCSR